MSKEMAFNGAADLPALMAELVGLPVPINLTITNRMPRDILQRGYALFLTPVGGEGSSGSFQFTDAETVNRFVNHFAQVGEVARYRELFIIGFDDANEDGNAVTAAPAAVATDAATGTPPIPKPATKAAPVAAVATAAPSNASPTEAGA